MKSSIKKVLVDFVAGKPIKGPVKKIINQNRNSIEKAIMGFAGLVTACSIAVGGYYAVDYSKLWINNRIKQGITQYEQKDEQRAEERANKLRGYTDSRISKYEQQDKKWTRENFGVRVPLEELADAFNSTYRVVNKSYYKTREGEIIDGPGGAGSGILLRGGYLLTAKHVVDEDFSGTYSDHYWGLVTYDHNELFLDEGNELEAVLLGENRDYALLKLKNSEDLSFYDRGLNLPNEVILGMQSAAMGYSVGIKNLRIGDLSQIYSDAGEDYLTFKNNIIPGDSGGPLFVIEEGEIKLTAIACLLSVMRDWNVEGVRHPTNIGYGLKLEVILEDIEEELSMGLLDEETVEDLENFLDLNK